MPPLALHHLAVKVRDVDRVAAFYRDVLGLPEQRRHHDARGLRSVWLEAAEALVMVERADAPGEPPVFALDPPGLHLVAFRVPPDAWPAWRRRLAEHGVPIVAETEHTAYVQDPEGNRVGLSSWPARCAP